MSAAERTARCPHCMTERPSANRENLAFFEDRAPGTQDHVCRNCRFFKVAHEREPRRPNSRVCDNFEPLTEGYPHDSFYDGCRGWD